MEIAIASAAVVLSMWTVWWNLNQDRKTKRRDLVLESFARIISNSKKLSHEDRKAFEIMGDSKTYGPLLEDALREASDQFRHEVGIERVLLEAFGDNEVETCAEALYQAHRTTRRAIWHKDCSDPEHADCEQYRRDAWDITLETAAVPSRDIVKRFDTLRSDLTEAVRNQAGIAR